MKALVAVEPTLGGDKSKVASIKGSPVLIVYRRQRQGSSALVEDPAGGVEYAGALKAAGGSVDVVDLPDAGIKGNSHMMMMDKNSDQIAGLIQKWLVGKGLSE